MARCVKCMAEVNDKYKVCPNCDTLLNIKKLKDYHLSVNTILENRYLVGIADNENNITIRYNAYDNNASKRVIIYEYFPRGIVQRDSTNDMIVFQSNSKSEIFAKGLNAYFKEVNLLKNNKSLNGIQTISDCFIENNTCYIVCEYERYITLSEYIKNNKNLSIPVSLRIIYALLYTLRDLHDLDIVHGNVSPEHIVINEDEEVKLIDFGVGSYVNSTAQAVYNPNYSAPEAKIDNNKITPSADVYSVAAVYYKMLTGVTPPSSDMRKKGKNLISIRKLGIKINPSVENAILNALNMDIDTRYDDANDFLAAIKSRSEKRIEDGTGNESLSDEKNYKYIIIKVSIVVIAIIAVILVTTIYSIYNNLSKIGFGSMEETTTTVDIQTTEETTVEVTEETTRQPTEGETTEETTEKPKAKSDDEDKTLQSSTVKDDVATGDSVNSDGSRNKSNKKSKKN